MLILCSYQSELPFKPFPSAWKLLTSFIVKACRWWLLFSFFIWIYLLSLFYLKCFFFVCGILVANLLAIVPLQCFSSYISFWSQVRCYSYVPLNLTCCHSLAGVKILYCWILEVGCMKHWLSSWLSCLQVCWCCWFWKLMFSTNLQKVLAITLYCVFFILQFQSHVSWTICYYLTNLLEPLNFFSNVFPLRLIVTLFAFVVSIDLSLSSLILLYLLIYYLV